MELLGHHVRSLREHLVRRRLSELDTQRTNPVRGSSRFAIMLRFQRAAVPTGAVTGVAWFLCLVWVSSNVNVANAGLHGTIPATISGLSALTAMDLSGNSLMGTIPSTLGTIASLM